MRAVAIDVTPLVGVRTGIGASVAEMLGALEAHADSPAILPYVVGGPWHRSAVPAGARLIPLPARVALAAWSRADVPRADRWLRGADVVHATNFVVPPSRLPTLVTVHDCSFALFPDTVAPHARAFGPGLRRAIRRGAHVHTTTDQVASEVEDLYSPGLRAQGRLHVVPFGVPALAATGGRSPIPAGSPYILAVGRLEPRKNLPALIRALPAVPDVRLVIAGPDGAARPAVDATVAALPAALRDRVLLVGPIGGRAKRAALEGALALAYPSFYEGFGFPILEAMAVGTPVLAADIGALREVAGGAALLVDPRDDDAVAAGLLRLASDEALRADLVARGRQRVATMTWAATAAGLLRAYERASTSS
ncbi:MAG TPA: glycosyltransferase family 1 protein [Mycobacteriales bacterium]|nr:glycosyltransferase family 1 protein [Mycobacteriales bacterium]